MKASPRQQQLLLELQELDTTLVRLRRRREQLPERAELEGLGEAARATRERFMTAQRALEDFNTEISRVESDVELVRQRHKRNQEKLESNVSSKEAQSLQEETVSLARRKAALEDRELELMEEAEGAQAEFDAAAAAVAELDAKRRALEARVAEADRENDEQREAAEEARAGLSAEVQGDVLAIYNRTRERYGIGAARLVGKVSEGSNMELGDSEYAAVLAAEPDELTFCPVSGAILVRDTEHLQS